MSDLSRWSKLSSYLPDWSQRSAIIASYLIGCNTIIDLGAGNQVLKPYIKASYIPVDFVSLYPDTIIIDFDSDWEIKSLPKADGIAIAGLLEHIKDPLAFIEKINSIGDVWAVSYMDSAKHRHSLISLTTLEQSFHEAGMKIDQVKRWNNQNVYRLIRR